MGLDRLQAHLEVARDLLGGEPLRHELQDLALARREDLGKGPLAVGREAPSARLAATFLDTSGAQPRACRVRSPIARPRKLGAVRRLHQIAGRTGQQCAAHKLVVGVHRDDDDARPRKFFLPPASRLPGRSKSASKCRRARCRARSRGRAAKPRDRRRPPRRPRPRRRLRAARAFPSLTRRVIVGQEHAKHDHRRPSVERGRRARTLVPPGADSIASSPPTELDPLLHSEQPLAFSARRPPACGGDIEPDPVVLDSQCEEWSWIHRRSIDTRRAWACRTTLVSAS